MREATLKRRERILSEIVDVGFVTVKNLAATLQVSQGTIRRDLRQLAGASDIKLTYGGASLIHREVVPFEQRLLVNQDAKKAIGKLAASLVADGDTIFLDGGTTCFCMIPFLKTKRRLTVIVGSMRLLGELSGRGFGIILVGGQYNETRKDVFGPLAVDALGHFGGYTAFLGAEGLSMNIGLTASDIGIAHVCGTAARNARKTVLLADRSKFVRSSFFKITGFEYISTVVTDGHVSREWSDFLRSRGIDVLTPVGRTVPASYGTLNVRCGPF